MWSTVSVYSVAPLRSKVWGTPSGVPGCPAVPPVCQVTEIETGPVPSVVMPRVAVAVVGPVCRKDDTETSLTLTAGLTGSVGEAGAVVGGWEVVSPSAVVPSPGVVPPPAGVPDAGRPPVPVVAASGGDGVDDGEGPTGAVDVADGDGDGEGPVAAGDADGPGPGRAPVVASAAAAPCPAVPGLEGSPWLRRAPRSTAAADTSSPARPGSHDQARPRPVEG